MTDTDPRRVEAILAQFPGPVRLTPSPQKWALFVVCSVAFSALIWFFLRRNGGVSLNTMAGWIVIAILAFSIVSAIGNLVPGAAYLKLDADGFEFKTLFRRAVVPWKVASRFRVEGTNVSRRVAFDIFTNEPSRSALFNYLIRRQSVLPDNYAVPHDDLARLMNEWRARALAV